MKQELDTKVFALGGLGEVGKNMYCVMHDNELIIVDAGVMFPEDGLLGIDYVIQDYTFLKQNEDKIKALFITHGHEDHIGGIPFLLQCVNIPKIYAPLQAKALIEKKLQERNLKYKDLVVYDENKKFKTKYFNIEFFRTTHSIPDSHGLSIGTPNGVVVMTGDLKMDLTPIGPMCDIHKMARIGSQGVTLLMSDSTNALEPGTSMSESVVDESLGEIFSACNQNRIIVATFASNIYRLKHIFETCRKNKRKIALFGRSMETSVEIASKCGLINDKDIVISAEEANRLKPSEVCLLCTGSQGEPLAALSRIANGLHRQIKLMPSDVVIFSSSPIPGNAASISKTINKLALRGVKVYTNAMVNIHSSGHGRQEELKLIIRLFQPKFLAPYHGEYRMLKSHCDLGISCGIPKDKTFVLENGEVLSLFKGNVRKNGTVHAGDVYVDGSRIGGVGNVVIKDRKLMSNNGVLVVIANIDIANHKLLATPAVTTRGYILINENEKLMRDIQKTSERIILSSLKNKNCNFNDLKNEIINELMPFLSSQTGRVPIILPIIMDVDSSKLSDRMEKKDKKEENSNNLS